MRLAPPLRRRLALSLALVLGPWSMGLLRAAEPDLTTLTLTEAAARVRAGTVTSVQLTEACLARIATYDGKLDSFITVMKSQALAQARALDAEAKAGKFRGPLHGVPLALKDNVDTANARTTGGSAVFADRMPAEDATVTKRLVAAGAVIIGKTNLQEFAMGGGETSFYGPTRRISPTTTAVPPPAPAPPPPRFSPMAPSAPTPAAPSACLPPTAGSSASKPPTASSRSAASFRSAFQWTTPAR